MILQVSFNWLQTLVMTIANSAGFLEVAFSFLCFAWKYIYCSVIKWKDKNLATGMKHGG